MHDPDLIIRTSGEQRLSNYLLWQSAYSELHFTEVLWPDFSREDFEAALGEYEVRAAPVRRPMSTRRSRRRRRGGSDLSLRVLVAIPAIAYAIFIIVAGGWIFAAGILVLGLRLPARAVPDVRDGAAGQAGRLPGHRRAGGGGARGRTSARCCSRWSRSCR